MMKIYGSSDDIIVIEGIKAGNGLDEGKMVSEWDCFEKPLTFRIGELMKVYCHYCPGETHCWVIAPALYENEDGESLPEWPMRIRQGTAEEEPYSMVLEIDIPEDIDAKIYCMTDMEEE